MQEVVDVETIKELIEAIIDEGVSGIMEFDFVQLVKSLYTDLQHKAYAISLLSALNEAAERLLVLEEHATFPALMITRQLRQDFDAGGPAHPPASYRDEDVLEAVKNLIPTLQMALIAALSVFPHPSTDEGKGDALVACGMLVMLFDKCKDQAVINLAVEKAILRLLIKKSGCISVLAGHSAEFKLGKLQLMIASLNGQAGAATLEGGVEAGDHDDDLEEDEDEDEEEEEEEEEGDQKRRRI